VLSTVAEPSANKDVVDAIEKVKQIVNQPVPSMPRVPGVRYSLYSPGWFHEGAVTPDFRNVDVRATQDLSYGRHEYVTSDLNPGVMFRGQDVEFNSMTKYFYTDRSLPKKRLTEAEMLQINRLYRIIARGEPQSAVPRPVPPAAVAAPPPRPVSAPSLRYASGAVLVLALVLWLYHRRAAERR
jgi:hypothetical protein